MMNHELAIDEDGEPFSVPPQVAGWRVRRAAEGRGRPLLVHGRGSEKGKPLVLRANASHADLLAAAGPGRYRLEAVDEHWHKVDGVPTACTGPLCADEDPSDDDAGMETMGGPSARPLSYENVLCHLVTQQTRMVEKALGQMSAVMGGVAELINAAHNAGITSRVPPPPPSPPPVEADEDEESEVAESDDVSSKLSEATRFVIRETIDRVVPLIFAKFGGMTSVGGIPLEALADWRKAAPAPEAPPGAPAASIPYVSPSSVWNGPVAHAGPMDAPPQSMPTSPIAGAEIAPAVTMAPPRVASVVTGAAPSPESPLGAAPVGTASPAASAPQTHAEAAAILNAHMLRVWAGLTPSERARAGQLIAQLAHPDRTAWLAELARLTVPEAIARARAILHAQQPPATPSPPATPQPPSPMSQGSPL